ncbi:MAG: anti-sigma factor, partial [Bacteroidota bacterium]
TTDNELKTRFDELEHDFEIIGLENAVQPSIVVKDKLMHDVRSANPKTEDSVINLPKRNNNRLYLGIAASFAGLLLLGSIWLFNELNGVKEQLEIVQEENDNLKNNLNSISDDLEETTKWYAAISNPDAEQYILKGNNLMPEAKIVSYVNHSDKSVVINTRKLPKLDADKDYQMWADVEGEMIDMGVIPKDQELIAMTYIDHAESLNITIEPAGGNDHPTVSQLISNVYLK